MRSKKPGKKGTEIKLVNFRWRKLKNNKIVITNDWGHYLIVNEKEFNKILNGKINKELKEELLIRGFIENSLDFNEIFTRWQNSNSYLYSGPSLHILVLTHRCNHKCVYCQSQAIGPNNKQTDMSFETAKRCVDIAFETTSPTITFEFQGGEPLYNWDVLVKTVRYIREKEKNSTKKVNISVVTNFSLMNETKAQFLLENEISICTSLDGPENLHNNNRIITTTNSYKATIKWLKYFKEKHDTQHGLDYRIFKPSALITITKKSLSYPEEIVDEYVKNGLDIIFLRPISPIGFAKRVWDKIGYNAEEFLEFYRKAIKYLIELNKKGKLIKEKTVLILLNKMLNGIDGGFVDLRCPCGAGIGQIAYNYNGDVYTCDEGRMVSYEGDELFKIGNIYKDDYKKLIESDSVKLCAIASNTEIQSTCFRCAYKPYCGVCPVINYETHKTPHGNNITSERCKIFMGIFDILFELIQENKNYEILNSWLNEEKKEIKI